MTHDLQTVTWSRPPFEVSTDIDRLDKAAVLSELKKSYWAMSLDADVVWKSIEGSVVFGLFEKERGQVGFARVATDAARFGWVSDVYVLDDLQGQGLGVFLMGCLLAHPDLQTLRKWMLSTDDAFSFYEKFGFQRIGDSKFMVR